jgi:MFS transporter, DHA3 family, macrolide efflux protein
MRNHFSRYQQVCVKLWQVFREIPTNFRTMRTFSIIWAGQCLSVIGSGLTQFALGLWVYQHTGSVTRFALIALSSVLPHLLLAPLAGVYVDRWDRRVTMILSDALAAVSTLVLAGLFFTNQLAVWHIYIATAVSAACNTLQWPAYTSAIARLVPKPQLGRANGMVQFGRAVAEILTPTLAGVLLLTIQMWGILLLDVLTFLFAVGTLVLVRFPAQPERRPEEEKLAVWTEARAGWHYITARPGLVGLLIFFAIVNFLWGMVGALILPMILNFTRADVLGVIISCAGGGLLTGSLIMSLWGGPKRRIHGVLNFELFSGFCFLLIGLRPIAALVALGAFGAHLTIAIVSGSNQAIWQTKVASEIQGRVFAMQQMLSNAMQPLAYLLAGPLADRVFEPLLAVQGPLAGSFGQLIGVGPGRGIALLFMVMGLIKITVALSAYGYPRIRRVEEEIPDALVSNPLPGTI